MQNGEINPVLECEYVVRFDDMDNERKLSNIALLKYLEEPGGVQTKQIFGSMITPKGVWILLAWRVKKLKEITWNEKFRIKTWPAKNNGLYSIRNFELYNENNELATIASTKWVLVDPVTKKIVRDTSDIISKYPEYNKMLFEDDFPKLKEPKNIEYTYEHTVQRRDIDVNGHVNNVTYLEIAYEAIPKDVYDNYNFKNIEIVYKHSAFLGENLNVGYIRESIDGKEQFTIAIKTGDKINAIIRLN